LICRLLKAPKAGAPEVARRRRSKVFRKPPAPAAFAGRLAATRAVPKLAQTFPAPAVQKLAQNFPTPAVQKLAKKFPATASRRPHALSQSKRRPPLRLPLPMPEALLAVAPEPGRRSPALSENPLWRPAASLQSSQLEESLASTPAVHPPALDALHRAPVAVQEEVGHHPATSAQLPRKFRPTRSSELAREVQTCSRSTSALQSQASGGQTRRPTAAPKSSSTLASLKLCGSRALRAPLSTKPCARAPEKLALCCQGRGSE